MLRSSCSRRWLLAATVAVGCSSGGGGGSGSGTTSGGGTGGEDGGSESADESGGQDDGSCVLPVELDCDEEVRAAFEDAPMIPGCFDAATPPGQQLDEVDPEHNIAGYMNPSEAPEDVGVWTDLVPNETEEGITSGHLPIHSIHRPTGKFLQYGGHETEGTNADEFLWYPPAPCHPYDPVLGNVGVGGCEAQFDYDDVLSGNQTHYDVHLLDEGDEVSLFCAGHVNLPAQSAVEYLDPVTLNTAGSVSDNPNIGVATSYVFTERVPDQGQPQPGDVAWAGVPDLEHERWYPTSTVLADGRIATVGGTWAAGMTMCRPGPGLPFSFDEACDCVFAAGDPYFEAGLCDPATGRCAPNEMTPPMPIDDTWCGSGGDAPTGVEIYTRTGPAFDALAASYIDNGVPLRQYPQMFVLPDLPHFATTGQNLGGVHLKVGCDQTSLCWTAGEKARFWDPANELSPLQVLESPTCTRGSSAVMYASDRIMKFGGAAQRPTRLTEILDLRQECPQWRRVGETGLPRHYTNGVLLPDGNVFAAGGSMWNNQGDIDDLDTPLVDETLLTAYTAELFDRDSESWCRLADLPGAEEGKAPVKRGYHSQSFLLPDSRVVLGSGGSTAGAIDHYDYWIYTPPHLFWGDRPEIAPPITAGKVTAMTTGGADLVIDKVAGNDVPIERVTLVKLSSSTHMFDQEQRFVELDIVGQTASTLTVAPPPSTCYATPGYYMLFALSAEYTDALGTHRAGVPSLGHYVSISGTCAQAAVPADPHQPQAPMMIEMVDNSEVGEGPSGLSAACAGEGSTLELDDFRQSVIDLCTAASGCPPSGTASIEARLSSTTGSASVPVGGLLDDASIDFVDGVPTVTDPLILDVAGSEFNSNIDLGPGDHVLSLCGELGGVSACFEQPLAVLPPLAGDDTSDWRVAAIARDPVSVARLQHDTSGLALGDDDVVEVLFPPGFSFPYDGVDRDRVFVGANGGVRFSSGPILAGNQSLPSSIGPDIAVYWDDLDPSSGGRVLTYADTGRFVVQWHQVTVAAGGWVTAQLQLLDDGRFEMHYLETGTGPDAHAKSATIGAQAGGAAVVVSYNDAYMLGQHEAFAFSERACVASRLQVLDSSPCTPAVAAAPATIPICAGSANVTVTTPAPPTICGAIDDGVVAGRVFLGTEPQSRNGDGTLPMSVGDYEARWNVYAREFPERPHVLDTMAQPTVQPLSVRLVDDTDTCCAPGQNVVTLTAKDNRYQTSPSRATCVSGLGGDDNLVGGTPDDTLLGNADDDYLSGGGGNDVLVGGAGVDTLFGGNGDDTLLGGSEGDVLHGDDGNDELWGAQGPDALYGGNDDDLLVPGDGVDVADAGSGDDHLVVRDLCEIESGDIFDGGPGNDTLWLPPGVTQPDVVAAGATVSGIETVATIVGGQWGDAECEL